MGRAVCPCTLQYWVPLYSYLKHFAMTPQKQCPQPLARGKRRCPDSPAWLKHLIKHFKISTTPPGGGWAYTRVAAGARALLGPLRPGLEASPRPCPAASSRAPRARPQPGLGEERPKPGGRDPEAEARPGFAARRPRGGRSRTRRR